MLVLDEEESECVERQSGAEPRESGRACVEVGLEVLGVLSPDSAVDAVGCDDEVGGVQSE